MIIQDFLLHRLIRLIVECPRLFNNVSVIAWTEIPLPFPDFICKGFVCYEKIACSDIIIECDSFRKNPSFYFQDIHYHPGPRMLVRYHPASLALNLQALRGISGSSFRCNPAPSPGILWRPLPEYRLWYQPFWKCQSGRLLNRRTLSGLLNRFSLFHPEAALRCWVSLCTTPPYFCLLYTSDAADDLLCVDLGGRRI